MEYKSEHFYFYGNPEKLGEKLNNEAKDGWKLAQGWMIGSNSLVLLFRKESISEKLGQLAQAEAAHYAFPDCPVNPQGIVAWMPEPAPIKVRKWWKLW